MQRRFARTMALFSIGSALCAQAPDRIYVNGIILTMDKNARRADAVATAGANIVAVGKREDLLKLASERTVIVNLFGKTMVPGFYAAHDHFPSVGHLGLHTADLNSPPDAPSSQTKAKSPSIRGSRSAISARTWARCPAAAPFPK